MKATTLLLIGVAGFLAYRAWQKSGTRQMTAGRAWVPAIDPTGKRRGVITRDGRRVASNVAPFREVTITNPHEVSGRVMRDLNTGEITVMRFDMSGTATGQQIGALKAGQTKTYRIPA